MSSRSSRDDHSKSDRLEGDHSSSSRSLGISADSRLVVEGYRPNQHSRSAFHCGNDLLDDWLKTRAKQQQAKNLSRTYVLTLEKPESDESMRDILGYYCLSSHAVRYETLADEQRKGVPPSFNMPTVLLGRLAVDQRLQGQGYGQRLLVHAAHSVLMTTGKIGIQALEVDAIDEQAAAFYARYDFVPLIDDPLHLILPMKTIKRWFES